MKTIRDQIEKLQEEIRYHRRRYYELNDPVISDDEFDSLHNQLLEFQKKYPDVIDEIGYRPEKGNIRHAYKMLSLSSTHDLINAGSIFVHVKDNISCEPKVDGLSIELIYSDGHLSSASTRGDGVIGEDVSLNVLQMDIPQNVRNHRPFTVVNGEIYMHRDDFERISEERKKEGKSRYSNPRNTAAGILRAKNSPYISCLKFYPYSVRDERISTQQEGFEWLKENGFDTLEEYRLMAKYVDDIYQYHDHILSLRKDLPFDIDGLVFKVNQYIIRDKMGEALTHPKWAIALKFKSEKVQTRLNDVIFQVGKSGIISPVACLDPVLLRGSLVTRASLANADNIKTKDFMIGDVVVLEMANDVIPYVSHVIKEDRIGKETNIIFPEQCPSCSTKLAHLGVHYVCTNTECPDQVLGRLASAVSRNGLNLKGFGKAILNKLIEADLVRDIADIFELFHSDPESKLAKLNLGQLTIKNLKDEVKRGSRIPVRKMIFALGIPDVSVGISSRLAEHYKSFSNLISSIRNYGIVKLPNVNNDTLILINEYFTCEKNISLIDRMMKFITVEDEAVLSIKVPIVITGTLSKKRSEFEQDLREKGYIVVPKVSSNVKYLVVGENPGKEKMNAASKLNIPILTENEIVRRE